MGRRLADKDCKVDGCSNPKFSRDMCEVHYREFKKSDRLAYGPWKMPRSADRDGDDACSIPGCWRPVKTAGICVIHANRIRRRGTPEPSVQKRFAPDMPRRIDNALYCGGGDPRVVDDERFYEKCITCGRSDNIFGFCMRHYAAAWSFVNRKAFPGTSMVDAVVPQEIDVKYSIVPDGRGNRLVVERVERTTPVPPMITDAARAGIEREIDQVEPDVQVERVIVAGAENEVAEALALEPVNEIDPDLDGSVDDAPDDPPVQVARAPTRRSTTRRSTNQRGAA